MLSEFHNMLLVKVHITLVKMSINKVLEAMYHFQTTLKNLKSSWISTFPYITFTIKVIFLILLKLYGKMYLRRKI